MLVIKKKDHRKYLFDPYDEILKNVTADDNIDDADGDKPLCR